jgi:hypothetical protein
MSRKLSEKGVGLKLSTTAMSLRLASRRTSRSKPGIQMKIPEAVRTARSLPEADIWATKIMCNQGCGSSSGTYLL